MSNTKKKRQNLVQIEDRKCLECGETRFSPGWPRHDPLFCTMRCAAEAQYASLCLKISTR